MAFANLEQRMARAYIDLFPPFVPLAGASVSVPSQEQFYGFMKSVYQVIFDSPQLFFKKINADDAYPNRFNRASYGRPKLINEMKKDLKVIDDLLAGLFAFGNNGTVEDGRLVLSADAAVKKSLLDVLPLLGLKLDGRAISCDQISGLFPAWKWMASRENASVTTFSRCMFDPQYSYMQDIFCALFGDDKAFMQLVETLQKSGYRRADMQRGPNTLDYYKQDVPGDFPLGAPMHGDPRHYGISAEYRADTTVPQFMVLRIIEMKNILLKFDLLPEHLKQFVIQYAKQCDDCRYCTQTDKSGKRKQLWVEVSYHGGYRICPLYPGFNFCFEQLNDELAANLLGFLDFLDGMIAGKE